LDLLSRYNLNSICPEKKRKRKNNNHNKAKEITKVKSKWTTNKSKTMVPFS